MPSARSRRRDLQRAGRCRQRGELELFANRKLLEIARQERIAGLTAEKRSRRMKFGILALLALLWVIPALAGPAEDEAAAAAKTWLAVVDAKNYPESWKDAADLFQQGVSEAKWGGMVQSVRDKVGPVKSAHSSRPSSPRPCPACRRRLRIVSFQTDFETKGASTEVISLVHENGKWKVGGYFIN